MVLNIFPRRAPATTEPEAEPVTNLPEPSPEALAEPAPIEAVEEELTEDGEPKKRPTRRGTRGGRGRKRPADGEGEAEGEGEESAEATASAPEADAEPAPAPAPRRSSRRTAAAAPPAEGEEAAPAPAPRTRRTNARTPRVEEPEQEEAAPAARSSSRSLRVPVGSSPDTVAILRAVEQQSRLIEQLMRAQEELARRGTSAPSGAPPARVGIFVDTANIELACDRLRVRFDWAKILAMLTKDRQLVRAIAYAPVHDDPNVSPETQRFAEPFLGKGYKVVTKALKRFSDGTVKANVDIELALDIMEMADRLDVVCLVSGDGDFVRLVEVLQGRGIRVEVVSVGSSTAGNLRLAADEYIDLQSRVRELRA
jgi:uncharacterized LabA/DUF88 family protein